jgi:hypothetical protein
MAVQEIEARIKRLQDYQEICNMQGRYNHYILSGKFDKILDMFAKKDPDVKIEMADSGEYHGIEGVKHLFSILGEKYGFPGALGLHMLLTPVVEVSKDGKTARGMWHSFGCNTIKDGDSIKAMWQAGKYNLEFVKEDGEWKYRVFRWYVIFRTPYDEGWVKKPIISGLHKKDGPPIGALYIPYDPSKAGEFLPLPPELENESP